MNANDKSDFDNWDNVFNEYFMESNKIVGTVENLNWTTHITFGNVLITGIAIVLLILKNAS